MIQTRTCVACGLVLALAAHLTAAGPADVQNLVDPAWQVLKKGRADTIAISHDGMTVAVFGNRNIYLWDRKTGKEVSRIPTGGVGPVCSLAFTPDGKRLVAFHGMNVRGPSPVFEAVAHVWGVRSGDQERIIRLRRPVRGWWPDKTCAILDNKTLLLGGAREVAALFDIETGKRVGTIEGKHQPTLLTVSRDGRWLLTAGRDGSLCVWDLRTRKLASRLHEHLDKITAVAISADGKWCACAGEDRRLWVFDRAEEREKKRAPVMLQPGATSLAFTPDGRTLVAAAAGPRYGLEVWDWQVSREARGGYLMRRPAPLTPRELNKDFGNIRDFALAPEGTTLFTIGGPLRTSAREPTIQMWYIAPLPLAPKPKK